MEFRSPFGFGLTKRYATLNSNDYNNSYYSITKNGWSVRKANLGVSTSSSLLSYCTAFTFDLIMFL